MTPYIPTLTVQGLAAIVNVQAGTIGPISISQIGLTDAAFTMSSTLETLPGEFKRLSVAGDALGDDVIHVEALDNGSDVYAYTGFGLYTSTGLLFAVYGQADPIVQKVAGSASFIVLDIQMAQGQSQAITFGDTSFLNPPATTDVQGVVELATVDEARAGTDDLRVLTPATALAALLTWVLTIDGAGSKVDADLLDGQEGAWYADIVARLGFVPLDSVAFTGANIRTLLGYTPLDAAAFTKVAILGLLGFTPQDAAASTFGSNANGYWEKRPNGVLEQWGQATAGDPWSADFTFPLPFADTASISLQSTSQQSDNVATDGNKINAKVTSTSTFQLGSDDNPKPVFWRAIGKAPA